MNTQPAIKKIKPKRWQMGGDKRVQPMRRPWAHNIAREAKHFGKSPKSVEQGATDPASNFDQCPCCGKDLAWQSFFGFDWRAVCPSCK